MTESVRPLLRLRWEFWSFAVLALLAKPTNSFSSFLRTNEAGRISAGTFVSPRRFRGQDLPVLFQSGRNEDDDNDDADDAIDPQLDAEILRHRIESLRVQICEAELERPPNKNLSPQDVIRTVLDALLHAYDPVPDAGFRLLLRASTPKWRNVILRSIGAPQAAACIPNDVIASALGAAMGRPNNQFAILVGGEDGNENNDDAVSYTLDFDTSSEPVDWGDGTCWVECRLRDEETKKLLVIMGWNFVIDEDGAWLIDGMDWQDFRDAYRPGIGREEWVRICG